MKVETFLEMKELFEKSRLPLASVTKGSSWENDGHPTHFVSQSKNCYDVSILILSLMMTLITGLSLWEFSSKAVDFSHTIAQSLKTLKQKIGFIWVIGANYKIDLQHSIVYVSSMYSFNRLVSILSKITSSKSGSRKSKNSKIAQNRNKI